ncbi:MAG: hypothetical protein ACLPXM_21205 [Terriglobales bacterium]
MRLREGFLLPAILCAACAYSVCLPLPSMPDEALDKPKVKAANKMPTTSNPKISINNPFTKDMAESAGLDPANPSLSSDGLHSGNDGSQKTASSECLFAETLVRQANPKVTQHLAAEYCETTKKKEAKQFEAAFPIEDKPGTAMDEALIHIVKWDGGQWTGTWYQYERHKGKGTGVLLSLSGSDPVSSPPDHLLAKGGLGFLAIHLNIDDSCDISYSINSTHTKPLNQQDVSDLISLAESYYTKQKGAAKEGERPTISSPAVGVWGGQLILSLAKMPASIVFTPSMKSGSTVRGGASQGPQWKVDNTCKSKAGDATPPKKGDVVPPKTISKAEYFGNLLGSANGGRMIVTSRRVIPASTGDGARGEMTLGDEGQAPASPANSGSSTTPSKDTANQGTKDGKESAASNGLGGASLTVSDEGLHWWDVSVAMPVTSYNKLTYSTQNNLIQVTNTDKIRPYALFDTYIWPVDLRMKSGISYPMIVAGIPLSNQPLQAPFVGTGFVVAFRSVRIEPLVGLRVEKDKRTTTLNPPGNVYYEWHGKLQVMLGFSISDAKKVLGIK